jgi:hypothetical protein
MSDAQLPGEDWSAFSTQRPDSAFSTGYRQGRPYDKPIGPQLRDVSHQPRLTAAPPGYQRYPEQPAQPPSPFAKSGIGKYVNRNANGTQFNKPAIRGAVDNITRATANAQYFRHAGFGAALRHSFGMQQIPSHVNDFLNARHNATVQGHDPDPISAQLGDVG